MEMWSYVYGVSSVPQCFYLLPSAVDLLVADIVVSFLHISEEGCRGGGGEGHSGGKKTAAGPAEVGGRGRRGGEGRGGGGGGGGEEGGGWRGGVGQESDVHWLRVGFSNLLHSP